MAPSLVNFSRKRWRHNDLLVDSISYEPEGASIIPTRLALLWPCPLSLQVVELRKEAISSRWNTMVVGLFYFILFYLIYKFYFFVYRVLSVNT